MQRTCCFFGHRKIQETAALRQDLWDAIERLITEELVDTFLFGSKSRFNDLCLELVTKIKQRYPHINRVYVRAEFPIISDDYKNYLLESYEDTFYPRKNCRRRQSRVCGTQLRNDRPQPLLCRLLRRAIRFHHPQKRHQDRS